MLLILVAIAFTVFKVVDRTIRAEVRIIALESLVKMELRDFEFILENFITFLKVEKSVFQIIRLE